MLDGRRNASKQSCESVMVETITGFFLLFNRAPKGGEKKTEAWLRQLLYDVVFDPMQAPAFNPILQCTVAAVTDGAKASIMATGNFEKEYGVLSVLCQLHALNRLIVHLFDSVPSLRWLMEQTQIVF